MVEKTILIAVVALTTLLGISAVGSAISDLMTSTECAVSGKKICIFEDPNAPAL